MLLCVDFCVGYCSFHVNYSVGFEKACMRVNRWLSQVANEKISCLTQKCNFWKRPSTDFDKNYIFGIGTSSAIEWYLSFLLSIYEYKTMIKIQWWWKMIQWFEPDDVVKRKLVPFLSVIFIKIQIHCHVIDHCFIFIFIHHGKNDHSIYKKFWAFHDLPTNREQAVEKGARCRPTSTWAAPRSAERWWLTALSNVSQWTLVISAGEWRF